MASLRAAGPLLLFLCLMCGRGFAQLSDEANDDPRGNINMGLTVGSPLNPTARVSDIGWGLTFGSGYNFTRRHAVVGEFMWNHLFVNSGTMQQIRRAAQDQNIHAGSNLLAFTGNYRFELRGERVGTYFIAGGGIYYRTVSLSRNVSVDPGTECAFVWGLWAGAVNCSNDSFTTSQTIRSASTFAGGVNGGVGFTARVGDAPYRMYVETRYHYAPTKGIDTQLIGVSVGIRY